MEDDDPGAAEASQFGRALLANIRHELRTPINAVIGYSEMLLEDAAAQDQAAIVPDLQRIRAAGHQLLGLVNESLDADTIEPGELDIEHFGATLRHQLRTPINAVIGYTEMLLEDAAESGRSDLSADLEKIHTAAERFLALIDDIVHFCGVEAGRMRLELESTDTSAMLQVLAGTIRTLEEEDAAPAQAEHGRMRVVQENDFHRTVL